MQESLAKIIAFIEQHHVMSLATQGKSTLDICSLFYAYSQQKNSFVVASSKETQHIRNIQEDTNIAANILLETKEIGKIQGLQVHGTFMKVTENSLKALYFKKFPYALALSPDLYEIQVKDFKLTDNRLGFGKKLIWP